MKKIIFLPDKLVVVQPKSQHKILYANILYVQANAGLVHIHTASGRKFLIEAVFSQMCQILKEHHFSLTHRSHLVNLLHVQNIDLMAGLVHLKKEVAIPLARRRIEDFTQEWYQL